MNQGTLGLPIHHQLPESTQTYVHWVSDAIQPSHPLLSPSPAFNLSQHQGLFKWVCFISGRQSIGVSASASVLPINIQDWSPLRCTGLISLKSTQLSRVFSNTTVQKHHYLCEIAILIWLNTEIISLHTHTHIHTHDHSCCTCKYMQFY